MQDFVVERQITMVMTYDNISLDLDEPNFIDGTLASAEVEKALRAMMGDCGHGRCRDVLGTAGLNPPCLPTLTNQLNGSVSAPQA